MTFQYRHRKEILLGIIIITGTIALIVFFIIHNKKEIKEPIVEEKLEEKQVKQNDKVYLKVDIKGEINIPGIYSLEENSRIMDAIEMAGGLTENADTTMINLSKKIKDEMVIIIYSKEEVNDFKKTKEIEERVHEKCIEGTEKTLQNDACIENTSETNKININTASKEQLMTLPGIGESKAKDIIDYREKNGLFQSIEDLKKVPGIGDNIYDQIKESIIN